MRGKKKEKWEKENLLVSNADLVAQYKEEKGEKKKKKKKKKKEKIEEDVWKKKKDKRIK